MFTKLADIKKKFEELTEQISQPDVIANQGLWTKLVKEHSSLTGIVEKYDEWKKTDENLSGALELVEIETDEEMVEMLKIEIHDLKQQRVELEEELKILLLPKDPNDDNNVIVEVRAGAGGDEAALFATEIKRMFYRYAERQRWKIDEIDVNESELGGTKEATFSVIGTGAYSKLKFESGVHRVQRVPATESQGRVHTSTITVAVLPEVDDIEITIEEKDLKIDTYRSGGAGGQHVNKTESAIRITHIPTGIVVACQNERSQIQNREQAMRMLKSKLIELKEREQMEEAMSIKGEIKKIEWGSQIRSYVFCPYTLVKDHRTGFENSNITDVMDGNIQPYIEDYLQKAL